MSRQLCYNVINKQGSLIMAQVLKDELRRNIIIAAKQELLQHGYENASMRSIAKKANMTVGNLYHYFANKEEIIKYIVSPTLKRIKDLLKHLSANRVSMETRVFNLKANLNELKSLLNDFTINLVDIYFKRPDEFNILMLHSDLNSELISWFSTAIKSLIEQHFLIPGHSNEKQLLASAYAESIFAGMKEIFKLNNLKKEQLENVVRTYLYSYIHILDSDIRKTIL